MTANVIHADMREALAGMAMMGEEFDAVVTDPPYGLSFMGKGWDHSVPSVEYWTAVLNVLKPGGHALIFGGTRTFHRMACAIEDAGFEIRDTLMWMYGTGFPKSLDVSKALDKMAGAEREVLAEGAPVKRMIPGADQNTTGSWVKDNGRVFVPQVTAPGTPEAAAWQGWGTALKPAWEPIILARKPLVGTVAQNVLAHGTGALNIDGCRVGLSKRAPASPRKAQDRIYGRYEAQAADMSGFNTEIGRWPANVIHDGSDEVEAAFAAFGERPGQISSSSSSSTNPNTSKTRKVYGTMKHTDEPMLPRGDTGSASRFFYSAKATAADRAGSKHPTVKPIALQRYLCRLITPPGGHVLDPFAGSGTTGAAALAEGFKVTLIEREAEYVADIKRRLGMYDMPNDIFS